MLLVDAPAIKPAAGGLLAVANVIPDNGRAGYQGVQYVPRLQALARPVPTPGTDKEFDRQSVVQGLPFTVYRGVEANLFEQFDVETLAGDAFTSGESVAAEIALQPVLNNAAQDATPIPGTAVGLVEGVATLEQWIGERYGGLPILHMSRYGATHTSSHGLLRPQGTDLVTYQGTPVANGAGYGAAGPGAVTAAAGEFWVYVTGQVNLWQGPLTKVSAPDPGQNRMLGLAERTYVPVVDAPVGAILVQA